MDRPPRLGISSSRREFRLVLTTMKRVTQMHAMTTLAFDTHAAVKALKEVGFEEAQAEAVVTTVGDAMTGNVATKADVTELRAATEHKIAELRAEMKHDLAEFRAEMAEQFSILYRHLWIMAIGIVGFTAGLTVALVQLIQ